MPPGAFFKEENVSPMPPDAAPPATPAPYEMKVADLQHALGLLETDEDGIVNLRPDELVKLGTNLDKGEQELFHKIVRGLPPRKTGARHAKPTRCAPPAQLDEIDSSEEKEIDEMGAHNKRLDCTPRVSSEDATSCLQQCARHPAPHAHLPTRPSLAPHSPLTRPSRLLRAGLSTASGCTRATMAASRSASESSCNECIHRTRPPARREALLN